ncbi:hypothetical protein Tco_1055703 [Tanacetum coccineum]|uniref:Uncharacterized protein n=1 Tax=Tanacetum coccineum TaxID=301880 RepID=A0ABQ5H0F2_9ASTR
MYRFSSTASLGINDPGTFYTTSRCGLDGSIFGAVAGEAVKTIIVTAACNVSLVGTGAHCRFKLPPNVQELSLIRNHAKNQTIDELPTKLAKVMQTTMSSLYIAKNVVAMNTRDFDISTPAIYVNHPIFNSQNDLLNSQNKLMEQMTTLRDLVGQVIQKKEEEKRIAEEQAAKESYWMEIPHLLR